MDVLILKVFRYKLITHSEIPLPTPLVKDFVAPLLK